MSWTFFPEGLIMPAAIPGAEVWAQIKRDNPEIPADAPVEDWLQVRGRVEQHLTNFYNAYMSDREVTKTYATPHMDYNFRFYARKQDVAYAYALSVMKIDYLKFKPMAYDHNEKNAPYYGLLNRLWSAITSIGAPGGVWADRASKYQGYSGKYKNRGKNKVGSTFYEGYGDSTDPSKPNNVYGVYDWDDEPMWSSTDHSGGSLTLDKGLEDDLDWTPSKEQEIELILDSLDGVPRDQWREHTSEHEWELIEPIYDADIRVEFNSQNDDFDFNNYEKSEAELQFSAALEQARENNRRSVNRRDSAADFKHAKKNRRRTREQYKNSRARRYVG